MSKRLKVILTAILAGLVVVGGLAWYLGLFDSAEEEASVDAANEILAEEGKGDSGETVADLSGTWTVEPGEATYVGYRVKEVLSRIGNKTAVGRTALVEGNLVADGLTISEVNITADLTGLKSDSGGRDGQLKGQALETNTFPEGTFVLTSPIVVDAIPTGEEVFTTTASGELTIHGQTQPVSVEIQGTVSGSRLVIIGSMDILMSDYGITPPSAPIVASIEDKGVMELSLIFVRE